MQGAEKLLGLEWRTGDIAEPRPLTGAEPVNSALSVGSHREQRCPRRVRVGCVDSLNRGGELAQGSCVRGVHATPADPQVHRTSGNTEHLAELVPGKLSLIHI